MITPVTTQPWTRSDLTGSSSFVEIAGDIYVVSNSQTDNTFHIYRSPNTGLNFTTVQSYQFPTLNPQFDPMIHYDGTNIHIIGMQPNLDDPTRSDLVAFVFDPTTYALSVPVPLVIGSRIRSAYDLIQLADNSYIVIVAVVDPLNPRTSGNALLELHITENFDAVLTTTFIMTSPTHTGDMYGAVSLISTSGQAELYFTTHQKVVSSHKTAQTIMSTIRNDSTGHWSTPEVVYSFLGDMIDDKLTVVCYANAPDIKVLTHLYYTRVGKTLTSTLIIGSNTTGTWQFKETPNKNIAEPTLCLDSSHNWRVAYIEKQHILDVSGSLHVFDLDPVTFILTERPGHFSVLPAVWVRGTRYPVDLDSVWMLMVETATSDPNAYAPYFVSEKNVAPNGVIAPSTATIQRGTDHALVFDASGSFDQDYDSLAFSWNITNIVPSTSGHITVTSNNNSLALVTVNKNIGPLARTFHVQVSVQDLSTASSPINPPSVVYALVTLPAKAAPEIVWAEEPTTGVRNTNIILAPTINDEVGELTYLWTQVRGTTVEIVGESNKPTLEVRLFGTRVLGETLQFRLVVNDGVNTHVTSDVHVIVPSVVTATLDINRESRVFWTNNAGTKMGISSRNTSEVWSQSYPTYSSDFFRMRTAITSSGKDRKVAISNASVLITGEAETFYRKRLLPNALPAIIDGWQTENDYTLVLDSTGMLGRYEIPGPDNCSDYPQHTINVGSFIGPSNLIRMTVNGLFNNKRVIAIHTSLGLMLFQVKEDTFLVEDTLLLSLADFSMYGADEVQFVRFDGVENLHRGKILIGTTNGVDTYETLFDLSLDSATGAWDRTNRINTGVYTGEILLGRSLDYSGVPPTPITSAATPTGNDYPVSWSQIRPDLISSYEVVGRSFSDSVFSLVQKINSGSIQTTLVSPTSLTEPYLVKVRSLNPDGASDYSNIVYLGLPLAPTLAGVYVGPDPDIAGNSFFTISWTQPISIMVTGFVLEGKALGEITYSVMQTLPAGATSTLVSVPFVGLPHAIRLYATGIYGNSPYSNVVNLNLPQVPTPVLSGENTGGTNYSLTWTEADISKVSSYILYGKDSIDTTFAPIATISFPSTLFFNISILDENTPYQIKMIAKGIIGSSLDSSYSNTITLTATAPPALTSFILIQSPGSIL